MERTSPIGSVRLLASALLLLASSACGRCAERIQDLGLSPEGEAAMHLLIDVEAFTNACPSEGVTIDGLPPRAVRAVRDLAGEPAAADAFALLLRCGSDAAALYGACGLRAVAPKRLAPPPQGMLERHGTVEFRSGCIRWEKGYREMLELILADDPSVRVLDPG